MEVLFMKKLFVSIPILNRNVDVVKQNIKVMHQVACCMWNEDLDLINSCIDGCSKLPSWYFSEYLACLSEADYFIGMDKDVSRLCNIEREFAEMFGLDVRLIDIDNYNCFDDIGRCLDKLSLKPLYGKFDLNPKISYYENDVR